MKFTIIKAFLTYSNGTDYEKQKAAKEKIAEKMKIPTKRIAQIINGNLDTVTFWEMVTLAKILDVNINELFEMEADVPTEK